MSTDFQKLASDLIQGKGGGQLAGKTDAIKKLADSADGKRVSAMMEGSDAVRRAVERGDADAMKKLIGNVLATEEGARLAKRLSSLLNDSGRK